MNNRNERYNVRSILDEEPELGETSFLRGLMTSNTTLTSGIQRMSFFRARVSQTITQCRYIVTTAAGATPTLSRLLVVVADVDSSSATFSEVANCANDTALFTTLGRRTKAFASSFDLEAGRIYGVGALCVTAASAGALAAAPSATGSNLEFLEWPPLNGGLSGLSDIDNSFTHADLVSANQAGRPYFVLLP